MIPKTIQKKLDEGRSYRDMIEIRTVTTDVPDAMMVEGYASTFNEPYVLYQDDDYEIREQIAPEAFDETDMSDCLLQYDHVGRVFARVSNGTLSVAPDEHGLLVRADLGGTAIGRQLYEEIKGGYTTKMSFGFTVSSDKWEETKEDGKEKMLRTITGIRKLYDVSAVSLPANNATEISARSLCEGVIEKAAEERRRQEARDRQKRKIKLMMEV